MLIVTQSYSDLRLEIRVELDDWDISFLVQIKSQSIIFNVKRLNLRKRLKSVLSCRKRKFRFWLLCYSSINTAFQLDYFAFFLRSLYQHWKLQVKQGNASPKNWISLCRVQRQFWTLAKRKIKFGSIIFKDPKLNLVKKHSAQWTLHCTLRTAHCTLHTEYCTLHNEHWTFYTVYCTLHTVH